MYEALEKNGFSIVLTLMATFDVLMDYDSYMVMLKCFLVLMNNCG
jgi:hypothetical protein